MKACAVDPDGAGLEPAAHTHGEGVGWRCSPTWKNIANKRCLLHSWRLAENSQSSQPSSKLFLCVSILATLPHQDLVQPSDMNTSAFAFGCNRTGDKLLPV
ncbi:hypothetical protein PoB_004146200 [Plakobranchus ocellatus]|uniref:Uncharacterized protein n=1 Tax=Plakobranchus ocellatus TaxID=259542 RepID=A0AAV4B780_9GAST|nr:hypothetical protein PoB_004146200 [Plakobranchus ocellatus]